MKDDDDLWFEALAGRAGSDHNAAQSAFEARLLRAALLQSSPPLPRVAPPGRQDEQQLRDALHAARKTRRCTGCARRWQALQAWWRRPGRPAFGAALAAFVVAVSVFALWPNRPVQRPETVLRGSRSFEPQLIGTAAPAERRNALATQLTAQGATVRRYERLGRQGLEAQLPLPLSPALQATLTGAGLHVSAEGDLRVEFDSAAR